LDLADQSAIRSLVRDVEPDTIVNAAAYTAVDRAELEREMAYLVNANAPAVLAQEAELLGARLIHYSTDYVFDGTKETPYLENDEPNPLNVYGSSKLEGERGILKTDADAVILRTSWVYSAHGKNFVRTILRLAAERDELSVVADQRGAPTSAGLIARVTAELISHQEQSFHRLYHLTSCGATSWYDFARAILRISYGQATPCRVIAVKSEEYPTEATRPTNSVLDCTRIQSEYDLDLPTWDEELRLTLRSTVTEANA